MRRVALRIMALIACASAGAPALADDASTKSAAMSHGWEFSEQGGADLYSHVCAACHQADAKGAVGAAAYPPLADDKDLGSAEFVLDAVLRGLNGMPPVGGMMSDAQVADVVNYVRTHFGNAYPDAISAADVAAARRQSDRALISAERFRPKRTITMTKCYYTLAARKREGGTKRGRNALKSLGGAGKSAARCSSRALMVHSYRGI